MHNMIKSTTITTLYANEIDYDVRIFELILFICTQRYSVKRCENKLRGGISGESLLTWL